MENAATKTLDALRARLLAAANPEGHWRGRLSSSALATAVASFALARADRTASLDLIRGGFEWMHVHQNKDGGWGDSPRSPSNLTATLLGWAALNVRDPDWLHLGESEDRAAEWLRHELGDLSPEGIRAGIRARYRRDRTFAGPILALCALSGRLGNPGQAWRHVPQLPFELAAFPPGLYRRLRLTVVSYALPALIAVGLVRHRLHPSPSPLTRVLRDCLAPRLLAVARRMQPDNGGYEEATPLTAFVVMCLHAAGHSDDDIVTRGVHFLKASVREDGSWPIDTDLATWITTLSIRALDLCRAGDLARLPLDQLHRWLLDQQSGARHPLTFGAPGGWAWTDLAGGMPDADDTAGVLLALRRLPQSNSESLEAAARGIEWLLDLQNADGGIPTFSRGWGKLPFDRSCPDISAHALQAFAEWQHDVDDALRQRLQKAMRRIVRYLASVQHPDGAWIPLWFGNENAPREENAVYGTSRVVVALQGARNKGIEVPETLLRAAVEYLVNAQNENGGWGGCHGVSSSVEETGLALSALASSGADKTVRRGVHWLAEATRTGTSTPESPIGLYFARLWYSEQLYPIIFAIEGLAKVKNAANSS
jgi:squalene-hopene/tetraprenyl-beta-curcumene cyclase